MHYKNGREAKNGDKVLMIPSYGSPVIGLLYDAVAGNDYCNGRIAPITPNDPTSNLRECLHLEDVMPIRPENRHRYGADWPEFSRKIRFERANGQCECDGECGRGTHAGRCPNRHGEPAYGTGSKVVLTVAHLNHEPEDRNHVKAMCQGCHLHYDREHHAETAYRTRKERANTLDMFEK